MFRVEADAGEAINDFEAWFVAHLADDFWIAVSHKPSAEKEGIQDI